MLYVPRDGVPGQGSRRIAVVAEVTASEDPAYED